MPITDIIQIVQSKTQINIEGLDKPVTVRKLTVQEREKYQDTLQEGFGVVKAGIGGTRNQSANLNMQKVNHADYEANKYLIKCSFTYDDIVCSDEDVDNLYDLFDVVVKELKRVNKLDLQENDNTVLEEDIKKQ